MEQTEMNNVNSEVIEEIVETTSRNTKVLKVAGIIGGGLALGALLTKFVIIPVVRKTTVAVRKWKNKTNDDTQEVIIDMDDLDVEDLPNVD